MIWLYYFGFALLLSIAGPILLVLKPKTRIGLGQKLGFIPSAVKPKAKSPRIWFHTCSVGEFNAGLSLIKLFRERHPDWEVFVSTTTATGQALANEKVGAWATVFYFPFDLPWAIDSWLSSVQPDMVAIVETELWPGFIHACARRGIGVCCVNGRISPRSFGRYQKVKWLLQRTLLNLRALAVQSQREAGRYKTLGANPDCIFVCGNMKFDGLQPLPEQESAALARSLNIQKEDIVILYGSTHEPEESVALTAFKQLQSNFPDRQLRLIIAPRHPERCAKVAQIVETHGYRPRLFSEGHVCESVHDVYMLDTIGQLMRFYSIADIAFVGGTLAPIGGHNLVEPCIYEIPVVCGPHVQKTRDVAQALIEREALIKVESASELADVFSALIRSSERRLQMGIAGRAFVADSQGAVAKTIAVLESVLPASPPSSDELHDGHSALGAMQPLGAETASLRDARAADPRIARDSDHSYQKILNPPRER